MMAGKLKVADQFRERPIADQLDYFEQLAGSLNEALDMMQNERNEWRDKHTEKVALLTNAQKAFDTQKAINVQVITENNARKEEDAMEINSLRARLKALEVVGGSHD